MPTKKSKKKTAKAKKPKKKTQEIEAPRVAPDDSQPVQIQSSRVRPSDLAEAVRPIRKQEKVTVPSDRPVIAYTMNDAKSMTMNEFMHKDQDGNWVLEDVPYDDSDNVLPAEKRDEAFAKEVFTRERVKYFVKRNSRGRFLNPMGMFSEMRHAKEMHSAGTAEWTYREVNKKVFVLYLTFLKTKNQAWLLNAEREAV